MLSENVKVLRKNLGLSQVQFSKRCNLPRTTLRDIESGKIANPTLIQICKMCRGCSITPNDLIPKELYQ